MRAVILDVPEHWLEERRQQGIDKLDEVWDGVLHMVPLPTTTHQSLCGALFIVLSPLAKRCGWDTLFETGLYAADDNYRGPDLQVFDPAYMSERGIERRAEIVVEILSPNDESRDKLPFYADCGVREVWLIDAKTRAFEIYWLTDSYSIAHAESAVLGIRFSNVAGPKLHLAWADGAADI